MLDAVFILAAIATHGSGPRQEALVAIDFAYRNERCTVRIEGHRYEVSDGSWQLERHLQQLKRRDRGLRLEFSTNVPYRCVGGLIFLAQRLGLRIGFVSEPPPR